MADTHRSSDRADLLSLVDRVRDIAAAHAGESERRATLAPAVVDAIRSSGLFAMVAPRALGGAEADPVTQVEVFEAMSRADTSAGWCLMIAAMTAALVGGYLPDAGAARVFAGGVPICAGLQQPSGVAREVPGGYVVHGRWAFGSGIRHAAWTISSAVIAPPADAPQGPPAAISVVVPAADVTIEDTWDAAGLRGSGSHHYRMEGVFVPDELTFPFPCAPARRGGAMFDLPLVAFLTPAHVGFALGAARRALDEITAIAALRQRIWTGVTLASHAGFRMDLGRAEARLAAARAYAMAVIGEMSARAEARAPLSLDDWAAIRLVTTHVTDVAAEVAAFAYRAGGGGAVYASSPLQRCFRDLHAATQHIAATDDAYEFAGKVRLGAADPHPLLAPRAPR